MCHRWAAKYIILANSILDPPLAKIHPTAIVDATAELGEGVEIGAYATVEGAVKIGSRSVLRPHCVIRRYTIMGSDNYVDSFCSLGGDPQDLKFNPETRSRLLIGEQNVFREGVTISRATGDGAQTMVGNNTFWMANSHAGHNAVIQDEAILTNGALVAGHATLEFGSILAGNALVHQFCWIGRKAMMQGGSRVSMHVPPYVICSGKNNVASLNSVGLRRSKHIGPEDRQQIKEAFNLTYRSALNPRQALEAMDSCTEWGEMANHFREFIRRVLQAKPPYQRGLCPHLSRTRAQEI